MTTAGKKFHANLQYGNKDGCENWAYQPRFSHGDISNSITQPPSYIPTHHAVPRFGVAPSKPGKQFLSMAQSLMNITQFKISGVFKLFMYCFLNFVNLIQFELLAVKGNFVKWMLNYYLKIEHQHNTERFGGKIEGLQEYKKII